MEHMLYLYLEIIIIIIDEGTDNVLTEEIVDGLNIMFSQRPKDSASSGEGVVHRIIGTSASENI